MGIGVGLTFLALGAILAFAVRFEAAGVDLQTVGWILIVVGVISIVFTLVYTMPRRRAAARTRVVEEPMFGSTGETVIRQERVDEHPLREERTLVDRSAEQDPSVANRPGTGRRISDP